MTELFRNSEDYIHFIDRLKPIAKFIEYEFDFQFDRDVSELVDGYVLEALREANDPNVVESKLLRVLFEDRININMRSANLSEKVYPLMFVKLTAILKEKALEKLKSYQNFYSVTYEPIIKLNFSDPIQFTRDLECSDTVETVQVYDFGHVTLKFFDKDFKQIIAVYCHEGEYEINDTYRYLLD